MSAALISRTREGCDCLFQKTPRTEGGGQGPGQCRAKVRGGFAFPGARNPRNLSISPFWKILLCFRNQEKEVLAKRVSAESSSARGTQSATAKRGVQFCKNPLLKPPFSWFLSVFPWCPPETLLLKHYYRRQGKGLCDSGRTFPNLSRAFPGVFLRNPRKYPRNSHSLLRVH